MATVTVLTPNGRRQNVKVTPNTTILQILEEVCLKHSFSPEEYDIKHHNKLMDTTTLFRFSGLPNNALLEMAPITKKRIESQVSLLIQLENGERLTGQFSPIVDLWSVLSQLCPSEIIPDSNPVVIYMRREIYGENNLKETNLKSLGLTGGRALLRLIHRNPESLKTQANVSAPLPSKPVEEKPYKRNLQKNEQFLESTEKETEISTSDSLIKYPKVTKDETYNLVDTIKQEKSKCSDPNSMMDDIKHEETNMDVDVPVCNMNQQTSCNHKPIQNKPVEEAPEEEIAFLGERNAIAFSLSMSSSLPQEDLPDEFFDLTINDARTLLRDLQRRRKEMDEAPLQTSALRSLEHDKKVMRNLNQYRNSVLRVQFPDRTVLQGTFRPLETVSTVMGFVQEYLKDKSLEFYLFLTPPKTILKSETYLVDAECVPSAIVHFGTITQMPEDYQYLRDNIMSRICSLNEARKVASKSLNSTNYIQSNKLVSSNEQCSENLPQPSTSNKSTSNQRYENRSSNSTSTKQTTDESSKVPKWFKTSNK